MVHGSTHSMIYHLKRRRFGEPLELLELLAMERWSYVRGDTAVKW